MKTTEQEKKSKQEKSESNVKWWMEEYGFFGSLYMDGDKSHEGYLSSQVQTLEERTSIEARGVISLLQLQSNMKLLDCPCGYGRHSNFIASKGIDVVGGDINSIHLNKAIEQAKEMGVSTTFQKMNMLNINYSNEFNAIINMFYSFGFFDTDEENFKVLKNFYQALKPDGKFLMHTDVNIPRVLEGDYKFCDERTLASGNKLEQIDRYDPVTKRMNGTWKIINPDGANKKADYSVRVYTKEEFVELCFKAGFRKVEVYSDWEGSDYKSTSEDMIIIAIK